MAPAQRALVAGLCLIVSPTHGGSVAGWSSSPGHRYTVNNTLASPDAVVRRRHVCLSSAVIVSSGTKAMQRHGLWSQRGVLCIVQGTAALSRGCMIVICSWQESDGLSQCICAPPSALRPPPSALRPPPSALRPPPSALRPPPSALRRPPSAVRPPPA